MSKRILFFGTEDWFFRSHFLPVLRRARADGFEVLVAARNSGALDSEPGVRVIDTKFERGALLPWDLSKQIAALDALIARERPDIIHVFSLRSIILLLRTRYRGVRVLALTGRGVLTADNSIWKRLIRWQARRMLRSAYKDGRSVLVVENKADARWVTGADGSPRVFVMPGAGVDPDAFAPAPEPAGGIVVGTIARLIRSKGVDVAVSAVTAMREKGADVRLRIGGVADSENPEHYGAAELKAWSRLDGVELVGRVADVPAFWAAAHIACMPSRGGEGLPRTLLEAGACGRPIVTTDTPGCADFVLDGETGLLCPPGDAATLADALSRLANDADLRQRLGAAGRRRVVEGFTEQHAADCASASWRAALQGSGA